MLLNEFLKEHKAFVEERSNVEKLQVTVAQAAKADCRTYCGPTESERPSLSQQTRAASH